MKKRFWILAVISILVVALAAPAAYGAIAGNSQNTQNEQFVNQMFGWHQQWLEQAQKDGQITPEQARVWQEHFAYMGDFHKQNGFGPMGAMMGGSGFNGMMGSGGTMGGGMSPNGDNGFGGMMGGGYSR